MSRLKTIPFLALCLLIAGAMFVQPLAAGNTLSLAGNWQGDLDLGGSKLGIVFRITQNADGSYAGMMDVPLQGAKDIPASKIELTGDQVKVEISLVGGVYTGRMSADGAKIDGLWQQNNVSMPLVMQRVAELPVLKRPQEPQRPYPYLEEEVSYENKAAGVKLAGTLTMPKSGGPFPAVLLITGSGAQDRDEALMNHRPFLVLADYLTRRGFAVLRVDDRGVGGSTGNAGLSTSADFADDALAGVAYLKSRKEINAKRIGLIGHSEGGMVAPLAASRSKDVAFIVLMAGPGVPGDQIIILQTELIMRAGGATEAQIAREGEIQKKIFGIIREEKDETKLTQRLREAYVAYLKTLTPEEAKQVGDPEAFIQKELQMMSNPWFRFFLTYDPVPALKKVACPVLALNGDKDLQVPYYQNLPPIEAALKAGGNKDFTVKSLPNLNHLFQTTCTTGSPAEYIAIEETIAPVALQTMGDWLLAHAR